MELEPASVLRLPCLPAKRFKDSCHKHVLAHTSHVTSHQNISHLLSISIHKKKQMPRPHALNPTVNLKAVRENLNAMTGTVTVTANSWRNKSSMPEAKKHFALSPAQQLLET